jgi:hypothetical protein
MSDRVPSTVASTGQLLDGAIALAEREAPKVTQPPMTTRRWAWYLAGQWYCAHHSVALLPELAERFEAAGRSELADFARLKYEEEHGHDQFAIDDLQALGFNAAALTHAVPPVPSAAALVDYARACVRGQEPSRFLGYVYALERRVLRLTDAWFERLGEQLPPGAPIATGLRAHATVLDHEHVAQAVEFICRLPARDRASIALGAHRATEISCALAPNAFPPEDELESWLAPHTREPQGVLS